MLNEADFLEWCRRLALTEKTQAAIAGIRSRNPTRRVGGGRENVSGRYPSRKMGSLSSSRVIALNCRSSTRWSTIPACWSITTSRPLFRSSITP
jgi:hypothetical protein